MKKTSSYIALLGCLVLVLAQACKKYEVDRPTERYINMPTTAPSSLHIPIVIQREALVKLVNQQLPKQLIEDENFQGLGVGLTVTRSGNLEMAFRQNPESNVSQGALYYEVPLEIDVSKHALITTVKANGMLNLKFSTSLVIGTDWKVNSTTSLIGNEWMKKPELSVGPVHIPIDGLTSKLLQRVKGQITAEIDAGIEQNVDLRSVIAPLYKEMGLPKIVSDYYAGYLMANPESVGLSELVEENGGIATTLALSIRPKLGLGVPPVVYPEALPENSGVVDPSKAFELSIHSLLGYEDMQSVLAKALVDTTIAQSGKSATIKEVELYGQDDRLVIGLRMIGDYTGWAYLRAQPVFDADSERMELRNIDITLNTKNILYKSIGYLFRNRIRKEINKQMGDQVYAQLSGVQDEINKQLSGMEVSPGIHVEGEAHNVRITESLVTAEGLSVEILFAGNLQVNVVEIPTD